ncbi:MAG TPA: hypothetical protein VGH53_28720 [Streptosporangiaceae bacterium]
MGGDDAVGWVGPVEAISLGMELQSAETRCPFTYKPAAGPGH